MAKTNDQMDRSFLDASIPELVKTLTLREKISLLAGKDWWNTVPIPRANIPSIKVTDGPNGARGDSFYHMTPATALPNATCIGASFSHEVAAKAGALLAEEAKARNAVCLLAPTVNIQRSPLGGRAFESFSEDPTHSGLTAAAYVNGLQENGISATIKHFVGNDQEHERMGEDSIIAPRPLREVYLRPFQIAQRLAKPMAYMTAYNKVNGTMMSENIEILDKILRKEWKFNGIVMSDWFGTYSVSESINAGLDLEMPGPANWHNVDNVAHLVNAHKIDPRTIDRNATNLLTWVQKLAKLDPEIVYAAPSPEKTRTDDREADAKIARRLASEGIVLLKNENSVLPITGKRVAVIGPNAKTKIITGGGSAQLRPAWSSTPWQALVDSKPPGVELDYELGCYAAKFLPILGEEFTTMDGKSGFDLSHYNIENDQKAARPTCEEVWDNSEMFMFDFSHPDLDREYFTELKSRFTAPIDGEFEFGLTVTGKAWLWVDETLVVDNSKDQVRGTAFFNNGTVQKKGSIKIQKGKTYILRVLHDTRKLEYGSGESSPFNVNAIRIGAFPVVQSDQAIEDAVALAKSSDKAVIVAGLNADWESEGYDRPNLSLPMRQNELISRVAAVQPNTVVVIQAGSAVSMPWINEVAGVVYAWYGGNEAANAIADVIYGKVSPSGRLPVTFPKRELDIAANLNYKSARTKIYYEEGIWVGYKHFNARGIEPLFPFGHGLSYTTFDYSDLKIIRQPIKGAKPDEWMIKVAVTLINTGKVIGSHSVHFYTCPPLETSTSLRHPEHALQAFHKVYDLAPGEKKSVEVTLDKYAISHWDEVWNTWRAENGDWTVKVGVNAQTMYGSANFKVEDEIEWEGL